MVEHSLKLLYMGVATLFLIIALTVFYSNEHKFVDFFNEKEELRISNGWVKVKDKPDALEIRLAVNNKKIELQTKGDTRNLFFSGTELKTQLNGLLLGQVRFLAQVTGREIPKTLVQVASSEEILGIQVRIEFDGAQLTQTNYVNFFNAINETGIYAIRFEEELNQYYIITMD